MVAKDSHSLSIRIGGFEVGSPSSYDGGSIVERSLELGQPVIYVSMNYRLTGALSNSFTRPIRIETLRQDSDS
ncbi:hypothetical protein AAF712_008718 [Marasmius tenuissimus]|uniref:Uncharacterized protein n=1 Tax=Marasmius tenuissimus TaxID=585030 RepID=A0ABR2ZT95_9AGAR